MNIHYADVGLQYSAAHKQQQHQTIHTALNHPGNSHDGDDGLYI